MDFVQQNSLILEQKWRDLAAWVYESVLRGMPKSEKFTLGADIRSAVWQVESAAVQIALRSGPRRQLLNLIDVQSKVMLSMIELGISLGSIPEKRRKVAADKISEIGRIVGGLLKVRQ